MSQKHTRIIDRSGVDSNVGSTAAAGLLAAVLLLSLAPIPHAAVPSSHTWRVELAAGLFLLVALVSGQVRFTIASGLSKRIAVFIAIFTAWGLISGLWARSFASVVHHTLLWSEYAVLFVFASEVLRTRGRSFLLWTFVWFVTIIGLVTLLDYIALPDFKALEGTLRLRYSAYGELSIAVLPLLWCTAIYRRRTGAWLVTLLPGILGWTAAMLSLSKGVFIAGVVGFVVAFACGLIFGKRIHRRKLLATAGVWLAVTIAVQAGFSLLTPIPATVDYISGKADPTRETSIARILIWQTAVPIVREHWLEGVGADNFGLAANDGRAAFRVTHPNDPPDELISDFLLERAHNEPLQVLAELGIPGLILFALPFLLLAVALIRSVVVRKERPSLLFWATCAGMAAFGTSSMVSSFSFRIVPNGIAFFLVFAFAVHELSRANKKQRSREHIVSLPRAAVASILLLVISVFAAKAVAEYSFYEGDRTDNPAAGAAMFSRAAALDPDYAAAHYRLAGIAFDTGDFAGAAKELRVAIDRGMGVVLTYSYLADCYDKAGDHDAEFSTFDEALRIFPRSVFLRVRYAIELEKTSRTDAAAAQLAAAHDIDRKQANGWHSIITRGSLRAFYDAKGNDDMAPPAELKPDVAVYQYLDKDPGQ